MLSLPAPIADVYIDESSQNKHRYLVLGGVVVEREQVPRLNKMIWAARGPDLPSGEFKWTKVSRTKLHAYKRIVDVLFDHPDLIHFHSLYVDTTKLNHKKFNEGSRELGFNKEIHQLAIKISRLYPRHLFHIYPDERETVHKTDELRLILNRGMLKAGDKRDWPFRRCQFRDSGRTQLLQLADVLIGAIAFRLNEHADAPQASPAKCELSSYILHRAKIRDVYVGTPRSGTFTVWPRVLR